MKIVRVINELRDGGVQLRLSRVVRDLCRRGHEVTVICTMAEGVHAEEVRRAGVRVEVIPFRHYASPRAIFPLVQLLRRIRPDVVHSHLFRQNTPATIAALIARVPAIYAQVHLVGTYRKRSWVRWEWALNRFRTRTLAVSDGVAHDIRHALHPIPPPRLHVLYNGVDLDAFGHSEPGECRRAILRETGWPADSVILLNAARLAYEKNQEQLLRAFARVQAVEPRGRLLLAGEGDQRATLTDLARALHLDGKVCFAGLRRDVPDLMAGSDLFVLPSREEGFSNAILEAMACGLPVIASDVGGASEQIAHGTSGLVLPPLDEDALTGAMETLISEPETRRRMQTEARRIVQRFTHETMLRETLEMYDRDLRGKRRR